MNRFAEGAAADRYRDFQEALLPAEVVPPPFLDPEPRQVAEDAPISGWRMWAVRIWRDQPWLMAPFRPDTNVAAARWRPGVNEASTASCWAKNCTRVVHPSPSCWCGYRAMSSLDTLLAFHANQAERLGPIQAMAQVHLWGNVVGSAPGDDWQRTIRASHARIHGPLYVPDPEFRAGLAEHYDVRTRSLAKLLRLTGSSAG